MMDNFDHLMGMSVFDASDMLQRLRTEHGIKSIVAVVIDGESTILTADYRNDRLQVETKDNTIIKIRGRG